MSIVVSWDMNGVVFAVLSSIFWGFNGILLRKGFESSNVISGTFTVVSVTYTLLFLLALPKISYVVFDPLKISMLAVAGVVSYAVGRMFTYSSVASIGSSRAFSGTSTRILFSAILGVVFLGEEIELRVALGTALIVLGLYTFSTEGISLRGLIFSVVGGLSYGIAALFIKMGMLGDPVISTFIAASFGFAALFALTYAMKGIRFERNLYLIISGISLAIGNLCYYIALSTAPIVIVVPLSNLYPLVTTFLSFLLIKRLEMVRLRTFIGSALTVFGSIAIAS